MNLKAIHPSFIGQEDLWGIKLRYLWQVLQIPLLVVASYYGYLGKNVFLSLILVNLFFTILNIHAHIFYLKNSKIPPYYKFQIETDLILFVIFLLLSGGTQNPFLPLFYILVFLNGLNHSSKSYWPGITFILSCTLTLQFLPYLGLENIFISKETIPYLLIQICIPIITYIIAHSLGLELGSVYKHMDRVNKREEKASQLKALGALSAGLSHEFASPLQAAQMRIARLKKRLPEDEDIIECELALEDCGQALHQIENIHRDHALTQKSRVDEAMIYEIIQEWLSKNSHIKVIYTPENFNLDCPAISFKHTLINLLDNASHVSNTIDINTVYNQGQCSIIIKDDGPGIPQHVLERIGQPFNTHKSNGTGLGIYSALLFMISVGGDLIIESNQLNGTKIELRFS